MSCTRGDSPTCGACSKNSTAQNTIPIIAGAVDSDSLAINQIRLRLLFADSPESNQHCLRDKKAWPYGKEATSALYWTTLNRNKYKWIIAHCDANELEHGEYLVGLGLAMTYIQYSDNHIHAEDTAPKHRVSIWPKDFVELRLW